MRTILIILLAFNLFGQSNDKILIVKDRALYYYEPTAITSTPSDNQIIFSFASIATHTDDHSLGTASAVTRRVLYGNGMLRDSVADYTKVLTSPTEDAMYLSQGTLYWVSANGTAHYEVTAVDTCYSVILDPSTIVAYPSDLYEITLSWEISTTKTTGQTSIERKYNHVDSSYAVVGTTPITQTTYADSGGYLITGATYIYRLKHTGSYVNSDYAYSNLVDLDNPNYQFTIVPSSAYFGQVDSTDSDTTMTVKLINGSGGDITLNDITGESLPFTVTPDSTLPETVADDDTLSLTITLNRDTVGTYSQTATLVITDYSDQTIDLYAQLVQEPQPPGEEGYCEAPYDFTHLTPRGLTITYNPNTDSVTYTFTNWRIDSTLASEIYVKSAALNACCGGVPHTICLDSITVDNDIRTNKTFTLDASGLAEGVYDIKLRIRTSDGLVTDHTDYYTEGDCDCTVSTDGVDSFLVARPVADTTAPSPISAISADGSNALSGTPKTYIDVNLTLGTMSADADSLYWYRSDVNSLINFTEWQRTSLTTVTARDTVPEAGQYRNYYVRVKDDSSNLSWSNPSDSGLVPTDAVTPPPNAPTNLVAVGDTFAIHLTWDDNSTDEDSFRVYRNSNWITSLAPNTTANTDTPLANYTQYSHYITAYSVANGESSPSNTTNTYTSDTTGFLYTSWYVDNEATGGNNGTSWTNAWESFSAINWGSIQPGDIIYLSGGTDSTIYYQEMNIGASGSVGNPITITPGNDAGHNGKVRFDLLSYGQQNINIASRSNITIDGQNRMEFWHGGSGSQGQIHMQSCQNIIIKYCYFNEPYGNGNIRGGGCTNIQIRYNHLEMGTGGPEGTRADNLIFGYGTHGLWIDHNDIIGNNGYGSCDGGRHCDNLQIYGLPVNTDIVLSNNFMYDFDPNPTYSTGCHQMLLWEHIGEGTYVLYNNVFYMPNKDGGNTILDKDESYGTKTYYVIHNTMITGINANQFNIHANTACYTFNNIFHATSSTGSSPYPTTRGAATWINCQMNMLGDNHTNSWTGSSFSTVQSWGAEAGNTIHFADPQLTYGQDIKNPDAYPDQDFHPLATSPAIDAGIFNITSGAFAGMTLQEVIESIDVGGYGWQLEWEDIEGNLRDSTPTIGAYDINLNIGFLRR